MTEAEARLREFYAAYARRDRLAIGELLARSPEFEWQMNPLDADAETLRGNAARQQLEELLEAFDELSSEIEDFEEDGDRVLVVVRHRARGRASGAVTERREVHLWTFQDGQPIRLQEFESREEAQRA